MQILLGFSFAYLLAGVLLLIWALVEYQKRPPLRILWVGPAIIASWPYWVFTELRFRRHRNRLVRHDPRRGRR